ncbi:MAG: RDD family protein [Elusimicrobia bacterium]|nr:RDD family protein [Elusimicrobiota bacterium]
MITRNLTILLTDIKGFTDKSSHKTRAEIQQMLDKHKEIVLPVLEGKGGKLVKTIGDAFLMTFESPTDAVLSGIEVQEALRAYNEGKEPDLRIEIRIAINQGEVNLSDNDVYGEPVNITARIEAIAEANEVFFTDAVYLAMNKKEVPSSEVGLLQLKGIPEKVRVYKVKRESPVEEKSAGDGTAATLAARAGRTVGRVFGASGPAAAVGAAASVAGVKMSKPTLMKRAGAVLIDLCLCGFIVSMLAPGDREETHIRKESHRRTSAAAAKAEADVKAAEKLPSSFQLACKGDIARFCGGVAPDGDEIVACLRGRAAELSAACRKDSLVVNESASFHMGTDGISAAAPGASASLDKNGFSAKVPEADVSIRTDGLKVNNKKINYNVGLDGITAEDDSQDEESDLGGGWKARTHRSEKRFPWFALCWFVYSMVFVKRLGTTPGGKICKLAVVQHPSGLPMEKKQNSTRAFFSVISGYCGGLGFFWALWEKDGRGWHDLMAGTRVVSAD